MFRPRVLLIAEHANPEWQSVPLEGWSHGRALAEVADVHVVTQVRNRDAFLRAGLVEGRDFTAIDSEAVAARLYKLASAVRGGQGKGWTTMSALGTLSYYWFERLLARQLGSRLRGGEFDLVHRITPLSPTTPSLLAGFCRRAGVPFVLGPLNGGVPWPAGFDDVRRKEREWLSYVRGAYRLLPGHGATRRNAAAILVGSRDTFLQVDARWRDKCVYVPENAVDPGRFSACVEGPVTRPIRLVFTGRLVPYKGADMLIEAAAPLVREGSVAIDVLGDGPEMARLRAQAEQAGAAGGVHFHGWVPHTEVQERMVRGDVFAFPSIREFGGAVVLEAMALGLVPVVVAYGGPAELVTDATGHAIPIRPRGQIVAGLRTTLEGIVADPSGLRARGRRARQRVLDLFTWQAKARQCLEVYRWVLGDRPDRPDFGMPLPDPPFEEDA
ncbi:MAG: glycosyltransferase family 4 protein [Myxococcota bacterium]